MKSTTIGVILIILTFFVVVNRVDINRLKAANREQYVATTSVQSDIEDIKKHLTGYYGK